MVNGGSRNIYWKLTPVILKRFVLWLGEFNLQQGENVEVSVDFESREYNERWYTDVKAWKVSKDGMSANNEPTYGNQDSNENKVSLEEDDIPF